MAKQLVVLAYSGGLDTSCILKWLVEEGYDVVCYVADVGQQEDFRKATEKAKKIGAKQVIVEDLQAEFVTGYVLPSIRMGLLYEGRYLLGTALARPCISRGLVETAKRLGAKYISHGATGKGNDQVRFELSIYSLWPEGKIIAPWRIPSFYERFPGRPALLRYAAERDVPVAATADQPWSTDGNIMHVSYESGVLEDPGAAPPGGVYRMTRDLEDTEDYPATVEITFKKGIPVSLRTPHDQDKPLIVSDP